MKVNRMSLTVEIGTKMIDKNENPNKQISKLSMTFKSIMKIRKEKTLMRNMIRKKIIEN